jgi:hypothetical protein
MASKKNVCRNMPITSRIQTDPPADASPWAYCESVASTKEAKTKGVKPSYSDVAYNPQQHAKTHCPWSICSSSPSDAEPDKSSSAFRCFFATPCMESLFNKKDRRILKGGFTGGHLCRLWTVLNDATGRLRERLSR